MANIADPGKLHTELSKLVLDESMGIIWADEERKKTLRRMAEIYSVAIPLFDAKELKDVSFQVRTELGRINALLMFYQNGRKGTLPEKTSIQSIMQNKDRIAGYMRMFDAKKTDILGRGWETETKAFNTYSLANKVVKRVFRTKDPDLVRKYISVMDQYKKCFAEMDSGCELLPSEIKVHPMHPDKMPDPKGKPVYTVYFIQERMDKRYLLSSYLKNAEEGAFFAVLRDMMVLAIKLAEYNSLRGIKIGYDFTLGNFMHAYGKYYLLDYQYPPIGDEHTCLKEVREIWKSSKSNLLSSAYTGMMFPTFIYRKNVSAPQHIRQTMDLIYRPYPQKSPAIKARFVQVCIDLVAKSNLEQKTKERINANLKAGPVSVLFSIGKLIFS